MNRMRANIKRIASILAVFVMVLLMVAPPLTVEAASTSDYFILGEPEHDLINGYMKYGYAQGYGKTLYHSIVVNFTSVCTHGEKIEITEMDGFKYEKDLSNNVTVVINMSEGKTLPQVCGFIRKIKFYNCDSANNKIKFTIGQEEVHYMTLYSEETGHYYQYIPFKSSEGTINSTMVKFPEADASHAYGSWQYSYYRALDMSYEGLQGYLCTITKSAEDIFLYKNANKIGWLGGTRMARGSSATKNGIRYYKSFTLPTSTSDKGIGYWYWASGPEASMKLGNGTGADGQFSVGIGVYNNDKPKSGCTTTFISDTNAKKYYYNWNSGEPNNSYSESPKLETECAMTTLKIGAGPNTSSVIPSGYSWNDIQPYNANYEGQGGTYEATGFFVEYGDAETGLKEGTKATLIAEDSETSVLSHNWVYIQGKVSNNDANVIHAYCTKDGKEKCSYYGSDTGYAKTLDVTLNTPNMAYKKGKTYNLATIGGTDTFKRLTSGTVDTTIKYYKAPSEGAISGGTALALAPTDIGFYYAEISATNASRSSTAKAVSSFKIYNDMAAVNPEGLNNLLGKEGTATENHVTYRVVENTSTATTDLRVKLGSATDELILYRLASMDFVDGKLQDVKWVKAVEEWLKTTDGSEYAAIASTPRELGEKGTSNKIAAFYGKFVEYIRNTAPTPENTGLSAEAIAGKATIADCLALVGNVDGSGDYKKVTSAGDPRSIDTYEDIKFGIYAIYAVNSGTPYNITTAPVVPEKNGPSEFYYVKEFYEVSIKEVSAAIEKEMRNLNVEGSELSHVSTFDIGDKIEFKVDFSLPEYTQKTGLSAASLDANGFDTANGYKLQFNDYMASGYTLVNDTYEGQPFKLMYKYAYTDGTTKEAEAELAFDTKATKKKKTTAAPDGVDVECALMKLSTSQREGDPTITIDFDAEAVKAWKASKIGTTVTVGATDRTIASISGFVLYYQATTNGNAVVGRDENTNKAEIVYEIHGGESEDKISDTTHGFTYAVNIVKIDGDSAKTDSPIYLDDTYFKLYKQVAAFDKYGAEVFDKAPAGTPEADPPSYANDEAKFEAEHKNYYKLENHNIINAAGDAVIQVTSYFMPYVNDSGAFTTASDTKLGAGYILTVAPEQGADGKTVKGLGPGNYILVEVKQKTGYNELAEDIYFEINEQSDAEAQINGNALNKAEFREPLGYDTLFTTTGTTEQVTAAQNAATAFVTSLNEFIANPTANAESAPTYSTNGTVKLQVLNFKGLTLPSTGGMGILIFIIIGVTLMASVIIIVLRNYKKLQNNM